jgi:hypothetical protein
MILDKDIRYLKLISKRISSIQRNKKINWRTWKYKELTGFSLIELKN